MAGEEGELLLRQVLETGTEVLQILLDADQGHAQGAYSAAFFRGHGGRRNGHYPRRLETAFGQVALRGGELQEALVEVHLAKEGEPRDLLHGQVALALGGFQDDGVGHPAKPSRGEGVDRLNHPLLPS